MDICKIKTSVTTHSKIAEDGSVYWTASFPSVPECVGGGSTAEEAIDEAKENLKIYMEFLEEERDGKM